MTGNDGDSNIGASYDPETGAYRASYNPDEPGSLVGAIIHLVSVATGNEMEAMPNLYGVIDVDALEALFRSRKGEATEVEFEFCGCAVTALSSGEVVVVPLEEA